MAKGLRSKTRRAFGGVKRQHVAATVEKARVEAAHQRLRLVQLGHDVAALDRKPLNRFLHPDAPGAEFPQKKAEGPPLDFRSERLPLAGLVGRGQRRHFTAEEQVEFIAAYNCLPRASQGPRVEGAREALRRKEALGGQDMCERGGQGLSAFDGGNAAPRAGEERAASDFADAGGASGRSAAPRIPHLKNALRKAQRERPAGAFRPKRRS